MYPACSSCEPWEKFSRATSMPSSSKARIPASLVEDGPRVQMILARRKAARGGGRRMGPDGFSLMIVSWLKYCNGKRVRERRASCPSLEAEPTSSAHDAED